MSGTGPRRGPPWQEDPLGNSCDPQVVEARRQARRAAYEEAQRRQASRGPDQAEAEDPDWAPPSPPVELPEGWNVLPNRRADRDEWATD